MRRLLAAFIRFMESDRPDRLIGGATKLAYLWVTLFPLAMCVALMVYGCGGPVVNKPDQAAQFSKLAGLTIPDHECVLRTRGSDFFLSEGSFIFRVSPETMELWLNNPPRWCGEEWKSGRLPAGLFDESDFGSRNPKAAPFFGIKELKKYENAVYAFQQDWSHGYKTTGRALILIPEANEVWCSSWDCREGL